MIIERVDANREFNQKAKIIEISNHGVVYTIVSDFLGIRITNDHDKGIIVYPAYKNEIVIR